MMIVKVCGMRDAANIAEVCRAGADWLGMIFYPLSPRFAGDWLTAGGAHLWPSLEGKNVRKVGVFVDAPLGYIVRCVSTCRLDTVQLHGSEPPEQLPLIRAVLKERCGRDVSIIKAFGISDAADFGRCRAYEGAADRFLFDTHCSTAGGSGRKFDWSILSAYTGSTPFLLSGGIGLEDVGAIARIKDRRMIGVDLNSRFEIAPGMKDAARVRQFISRLRELAGE